MRFEEHDDATLTFPELTPEDSATLAQVRDQYNVMDPHEYLAFLLQFSKSHPPTREIPPFHEPFKL